MSGASVREALRRAERSGRPGLPLGRFRLSRRPGDLLAVLVDEDGGVVFDPGARIQGAAPSPDGRLVALEVSDDGTETGRVLVVDTSSRTSTEVEGVAVRHARMAWAGEDLILVDAQGRCLRVRRGEPPRTLLTTAAGARVVPIGVGGRMVIARTDQVRTRLTGADGAGLLDLPRVRSISAAEDTVLAVTSEELVSLRIPGQGTARCRLETLPGVPVHAQAVPGGGLVHLVGDGHSLVVRLTADAGVLAPAQTVAISREHDVRTVSGLSWAPGGAWVRIESPAGAPKVMPLEEATGSTSEGPRSRLITVTPRSRLITVTAEDGAEIELIMTGDPGGATLLEVYGGFGIVDLPAFEPSVAAWCELGGLHVTARLRGGGGAGTSWHTSGQGAGKARTVADAVIVARELVRLGLTRPERLVLAGASLGGLVAVSAALAEPGLAAGVACTAAPLDPHNISEHPSARHWAEEFGDPSDPAVQAAMDDYSPFERARRFPGGRWPRFLLTTFAEDSRVSAAPTDRLAEVLTARGAQVDRVHRPRMGHGGNHLDAVHDFAAAVLDFALDAAHDSAHESTGV
ncbi:prolyl oligopeptidase family serine peptidase [Nocardioides sp.]|uniref:prolyl oligopeptidase family serine peptidase n=1 Tax=Nocardioides sp. TaxID=35761 RepID=UPI00198D806C|nr:prolyl oligopeptidase family serine peptidase [Nocardioides sp.]MBC7278098.1 S9 family peptidase [Nocardioides sp.]